jgi:hypothetical protein
VLGGPSRQARGVRRPWSIGQIAGRKPQPGDGQQAANSERVIPSLTPAPHAASPTPAPICLRHPRRLKVRVRHQHALTERLGEIDASSHILQQRDDVRRA